MRSSSRKGVPIEVLRSAVRAYVEAEGFRRASADMDVSVGGLHGFLGGATPYLRTLRKIERWYLATREEQDEVTAELAEIALNLVTRDVPDTHRDEVRAGLLEDHLRRRAELGIPPPAWLKELLK